MVRGREAKWAVAVVVLLVSVRQGAGQQCSTYALNLSACLPYVMEGNSTQVGADCCSPLKSLVSTRPDCVCTLQSFTTGVPDINVTRADSLNILCNIVSNATLSSCNGSTPAPSPTLTPTRNGAFSPNKASMFHVAFMGLASLVCLLNHA